MVISTSPLPFTLCWTLVTTEAAQKAGLMDHFCCLVAWKFPFPSSSGISSLVVSSLVSSSGTYGHRHFVKLKLVLYHDGNPPFCIPSLPLTTWSLLSATEDRLHGTIRILIHLSICLPISCAVKVASTEDIMFPGRRIRRQMHRRHGDGMLEGGWWLNKEESDVAVMLHPT